MKKASLHNRVNRDILKQQMLDSTESRTTISFYKYHHIVEPQNFRNELYLKLDAIGTKGRIYVATEGVNGQISVPSAHVELFQETLYSIPFLNGIRLNFAVDDDGKSFYKLIIKVRSKIVADGLDDSSFNPADTGVHLSAEEFNRLTDDPSTILVDMRNHYESEVGHFKGAILPEVETFREELDLVDGMLRGNEGKNLVMYCTGGIRCEKASAWFKHQGFKNVFQLDGGIIQYARHARERGLENKFIGVNFVFDERLGERISEDIIAKCHQCGAPCDVHKNCANDACHLLFIQCKECEAKYESCCSEKCRDFTHLPKEEQLILRKTEEFNGTRFGKGRYKAHHNSAGLLK
ncbi:MAG: rhodanese-related sulfurtransferase [Saprospiraceae bacterium]|nr:rhodanese-related sulfurtransferase [Saprospiraceae bacterium]